jgi:hypothetical protein
MWCMFSQDLEIKLSTVGVDGLHMANYFSVSLHVLLHVVLLVLWS